MIVCGNIYSFAYWHSAAAAVWRQIKAVYEDLHQRRDALLSANPGLTTPAANGAPAPEAADGERGQALRRSCSSFKCEPSLDPGAFAPLCASTSATIVPVVLLCPSHTSLATLPAWLAVYQLRRVLLRAVCKGVWLHISDAAQVHAEVCGVGGRRGARGGDGGGAGRDGGRARARAAQRRPRPRAADLDGEAGAPAMLLIGVSRAMSAGGRLRAPAAG